MLYRGTTAEEMGDPVEAMRWYKRTELADTAGKQYCRAAALKQMGILYQINGITKYAIGKYRQALDVYDTFQTRQRLFCMQQLSQLYQKPGVAIRDSAWRFNEASIAMAAGLSDSLSLAVAQATRVQLLFSSKDYEAAKNAALETIRRFGRWSTFDCWHFASQSYAELHLADSAEYYAVNAPAPVTPADTSTYYHSLSLIHGLRGEWSQAQRVQACLY